MATVPDDRFLDAALHAARALRQAGSTPTAYLHYLAGITPVRHLPAIEEMVRRGEFGKGKAMEETCREYILRIRREREAAARRRGREEGRKEGRKEGREEGREEGRAEGLRRALDRLLRRRFRRIPARVTAQLASAPADTLEAWLDAALEAASLDDLFPAH